MADMGDNLFLPHGGTGHAQYTVISLVVCHCSSAQGFWHTRTLLPASFAPAFTSSAVFEAPFFASSAAAAGAQNKEQHPVLTVAREFDPAMQRCSHHRHINFELVRQAGVLALCFLLPHPSFSRLPCSYACKSGEQSVLCIYRTWT